MVVWRALAVFLLISVLLAGGVFFAQAQPPPVQRDVGVSIEIPSPEQEIPKPGPGPADTRAGITVEGFGPPQALLFIQLSGAVARTAQIPISGIFSESISGLSLGQVKASIFAQDSDSLTTPAVSVDVVLFAAQVTRIFDLLLPPTITVNNKKPDIFGNIEEIAVRQGERVVVSGQTFPRASVRVTRFPDRLSQEVLADRRGKWEGIFATDKLVCGYSVTVRSQLASGLVSEASNAISFIVIPLPGREPVPPREPGVAPPARPEGPVPEHIDFNNDRLINIIDFSILLYSWGTPQDSRADLNGDGIVNLIDLSILLYWWTG